MLMHAYASAINAHRNASSTQHTINWLTILKSIQILEDSNIMRIWYIQPRALVFKSIDRRFNMY